MAGVTSLRRFYPSSGAILLGPAILYLCSIYFAPVADVLGRSFQKGGAAYGKVLGSSAVVRVLIHTILYAGEITALSLACGLPVAYAAWRANKRYRGMILLAASIPLWTSLLVRTFAWQGLLGRAGVIAWVLKNGLGLASVPQMSGNTFGAVVGSVYVMVPYMVLALYAGLLQIDTRLFDASRTLGASKTQTMVAVFLPLAGPAILSGSILVFILSLGFFVPPSLLGGPADQTIAMLIAERVNVRGDFPAAAALSAILLGVTFALLLLLALLPTFVRLLQSRGGRGETPSWALRAGASLRPLLPLLRLFESRRLWLVLNTAVLAFLLLPLLVIVPLAFTGASYIQVPVEEWSTRWIEQIATSQTWMPAGLNSVLVAIGASLLAGLVGVTAALGIRDYSRGMGRLLVALFMAPAVLPIIVYGIGAFFMAARFGLVDTRWGLIFAHSSLGLPLVVVTVHTALTGTSRSLEGAARTLGASAWAVLRRITLPLVAPSIVTGLVLAFLTSFDEVVVALFLSGVRTRTLPKELWLASTLEVSPVIMAVGLCIILFVLALAAAAWSVRRVIEFGRGA